MDFKYRNEAFTIEGVTQQDHIYKEIVRKSAFYEMDLLEYIYGLRSFFNRQDSITIDVGANIGNHSIFFRSFLTTHVISVEPNPQVLPVLTANLEYNIDSFTIYPFALGATPGRGGIFFPEDSAGDVGMGKIDLESDHRSIDIITLDTMLADWKHKHQIEGSVTLIKVDVEGMELDVLKGAQKTIEKNRPHLLLEAQTQDEFLKLKRFLKDLGYADLSHWTSTPVYHFCYHPSVWLRMNVFYARMKALVLETLIRRAKRVLHKILA